MKAWHKVRLWLTNERAYRWIMNVLMVIALAATLSTQMWPSITIVATTFALGAAGLAILAYLSTCDATSDTSATEIPEADDHTKADRIEGNVQELKSPLDRMMAEAETALKDSVRTSWEGALLRATSLRSSLFDYELSMSDSMNTQIYSQLRRSLAEDQQLTTSLELHRWLKKRPQTRAADKPGTFLVKIGRVTLIVTEAGVEVSPHQPPDEITFGLEVGLEGWEEEGEARAVRPRSTIH